MSSSELPPRLLAKFDQADKVLDELAELFREMTAADGEFMALQHLVLVLTGRRGRDRAPDVAVAAIRRLAQLTGQTR